MVLDFSMLDISALIADIMLLEGNGVGYNVIKYNVNSLEDVRRFVVRGRVIIAVLLVPCLIVLTGLAFGAEQFGVIFDIRGNAVLKSAEGDITELKRSNHILRPVKIGDTIEVSGPGKVLVVSIKDKKGYELLHDTKAKVQGSGLARIMGTVNIKGDYNVPSKGGGEARSGIMFRGEKRDRCIESLLPLNTSVLTLTPTLRWKITCKVTKMVTVIVLMDRYVVFEEITDKSSVTIPPDVLKEEKTYRWLVDGGPASVIIGGTLYTLDNELASAIIEKKENIAKQSVDLPERLSFLFLLIEQNLLELAEAEIEKLRSDFPQNTFIQKLR